MNKNKPGRQKHSYDNEKGSYDEDWSDELVETTVAETKGAETKAEKVNVSEPNIQCYFQSFNSALQDEVQRIEAKRKEVESQEKALNDERERMMQTVVKDDDVISLNIGGKNMAASRSTLCQVKGSLLASMFSGRWEDGLKKDKQGNVFLDFNPTCFKLILNYLRAKKIETPRSQAKKPKPPEEETSNYWNLVEYLGLRDELTEKLQPVQSYNKPIFNQKSKGCNETDELRRW